MYADQFDSLRHCLAVAAGQPSCLFNDSDMRIVSLSAALLSSGDKARLRMLEAAGDNAISMAVATKCLAIKTTAQVYQDVRSVVTANAKLSQMFVMTGLTRFVTFSAGVSPAGRAGANAFEAFVGLIYIELGMNGVISFCDSVCLFDDCFK